MSFWMLEMNSVREGADGREYMDTDIDSGFGYFLTEQDAHNFLDEQGLSYNVRDKPLLEKYQLGLTKAKRKFSRAKTAYNKARAAGVDATLTPCPPTTRSSAPSTRPQAPPEWMATAPPPRRPRRTCAASSGER